MSTATLAHDGNIGGEVDTTPLLRGHIFGSRQIIRRPPSLRGAARFLRRASSRRMMREPSMRVREAAAEQLEERQSDWAYSMPIVVLDLLWNFAFVMVSIFVLVFSRNENPTMPLRLWILGYCLQCVVHMVCVCVEYKRRLQQLNLSGSLRRGNSGSVGGGERWSSGNSSQENRYLSSDQRSKDDETRLHSCTGHMIF